MTDTARIEDAHRCPACGAPPLHWEWERPFVRTENGNWVSRVGQSKRRLVSEWEKPDRD